MDKKTKRYRIGIISLGCSKNLVDTEVMLGLLSQKGYTITLEPGESDIIIVNTCSFIKSAKKEAFDTILETANLKRQGVCKVLIVTGCLAQEYGTRLFRLIPEIDALVGTGEFTRIIDIIEGFLKGPFYKRSCYLKNLEFLYNHTYPRFRATVPHLAYIKIAEGCNHRCSYCLIPRLRGKYRSRTIESIVCETEALIADNVKEICLIAQDTTAFGQEQKNGIGLTYLLESLARQSYPLWIRFFYTHPSSIKRDLIEVMAQYTNIIPYLDIPLQHTHPKILKSMNRPYNIDKIEELIDFARTLIPDIVIRTTLMVGFPGETEKEFESMLERVEKIKFDRLGVFKYSKEKNTHSYNLSNHVKEYTKEERYRIIMEKQATISLQKNSALRGKVREVICDYPEPAQKGVMIGRIKEQAPEIDGITLIKGDNLFQGEIYKIRITGASAYDLEGIII